MEKPTDKIHFDNYEELSKKKFIEMINIYVLFDKFNYPDPFESMNIDVEKYEDFITDDYKDMIKKYVVTGNYNDTYDFMIICNTKNDKLDGEYSVVSNNYKINHTAVYSTYYVNGSISDLDLMIDNGTIKISYYNEDGVRDKLYRYESFDIYTDIKKLFTSYPSLKIGSCWYDKKIFVKNLRDGLYDDFTPAGHNIKIDNMLIIYNGYDTELERIYFNIPYISVYWIFVDGEKKFIKSNVYDPIDLTMFDIEY